VPAPVLPLVASWHMGALHPFEQALTLLLAFGPFAVLGLVVWRRRGEDERADRRDDRARRHHEDEGVPQGD
jgi:hypothetical protein